MITPEKINYTMLLAHGISKIMTGSHTRDGVKSIRSQFLKNIQPQLGNRESLVVKFTGENKKSLALHRQAVFVPRHIAGLPIVGG